MWLRSVFSGQARYLVPHRTGGEVYDGTMNGSAPLAFRPAILVLFSRAVAAPSVEIRTGIADVIATALLYFMCISYTVACVLSRP